MATLEKIRSRAGLLVTVIGVALFAFIIGDFMNSGSTFWRQTQENIISVNGQKMNVRDFQTQVDELTEVYKMQYGQQNMPEQLNQQIVQTVFENYVMTQLLGEEFEKIGMSLSAEELFDMIQGDNVSPMLQQMPMFANQQTGQFDKAQLITFLKNINSDESMHYGAEAQQQIEQARKFWLFWEKSIRQQRLQEKFSALLSKAMSPNSLDLKANFEDNKINYNLAYVAKHYFGEVDSTIQVSASEVKKEYEAKKELYRQEESRVVKYLAVEIHPSSEDFNEAEQTMNKVKDDLAAGDQDVDVVNENSDVPFVDAYVAVASLDAETKNFVEKSNTGDINGPLLTGETFQVVKILGKNTAADSVRASQIMIPLQDEVAANKLADSLMLVAKTQDFAQLAVSMSGDTENNGDLGWFTESSAVKSLGEEFKTKAFSAAKGELYKIKTMYGVHLVKITDKTAPVAKVKLANVELKVVPSSKTYSALYNDINAILATNTTVDKFEAASKEKGFEIAPATVQPTDYTLGMLSTSVRPAIRWAFNNKVGAISEIFETNTHFVVMAVTGVSPKGYAPLAQVEGAIRYRLFNQKKGEKIAAEIKAKGASSLEAVASSLDSKVDSVNLVTFNTRRIAGLGEEPMVLGALSHAQVGQVSEPICGNGGVYVLQVVSKEESEKPFDMSSERATVSMMNSYRISYQSFDILRRAADIVDSRYKFY